MFEKAEGIDNENENEIKIEEYPSLSAINNQIEKNNNDNSNEKSAAPVEINIVKKDE